MSRRANEAFHLLVSSWLMLKITKYKIFIIDY